MGSMLEKYKWFEWSCHTNFSFLKAAGHPEEFIARAKALQYGGLGINDYDGVYGIVRAWREGRKDADFQKNFRLFYGVELHLADHQALSLDARDTIISYALNLSGYSNLCQIISKAHQKGKHQPWISPEELISLPCQDLIFIQPSRGILYTHGDEFKQRIELFREAFGPNFYQLFTRNLVPNDSFWQAKIVQECSRLDVPLLFSQDAYYPDPSQKFMHDLLQAIRLNCTLEEAADFLFVNDEKSLHSLREIEARFSCYSFFEKSLSISCELSEKFNFDLKELRYRYPQELIPEGFTSQTWLERSCYHAARERYGCEIPKKIYAILERELSLVKELQFSDYFLTVWEIVRWAKAQGILCQGRGSAANSVICYVLGITSVDPGSFDVLFERFLSVERGDPPDIDVDFEHERREEVIQHIYDFYGRDRAAMVANIITFRTRGALRAVGKALGFSEEYLAKVSQEKSTLTLRGEGPAAILASCKERDFQSTGINSDVAWRLWGELAAKLKGYPRHLGIHSGGFVITGESLINFSPIELTTMPGRQVIQWSKDDIEALSFFKIDILALGMLTAIQKTFDLLAKNHGRYLTLASIPVEDPSTFDMISKADTIGTFQIESRAQMSMLPRLRPRTFYDLVIQVAIIRPGPIQGGFIHPYLQRRSGKAPIEYAHPKLIPILKRTLGIPLFQEQVMRIAMAIGGFNAGEADELRRHLGSWKIKGDLSPWLSKLRLSMLKENIPQQFIDSTLKQMEGFSAYGFPESHAVSFALIAYASSWLKCHYPEAFFTALLNSQPMGFYSPHTLLQSARRDEVQILPPSILYSDWDYTLEPTAVGVRPFAIRVGLRSINGLLKSSIEAMIDRRKVVGSWANHEDLIQERVLDRMSLVSLASAGALSEFGITRRTAIWAALKIPCFGTLKEYEAIHSFPKESPKEMVDGDFKAMNTSLYMHPAEVEKVYGWRYEFPVTHLTTSRQIQFKSNGDRCVVFGIVIVRQAPPTAKGILFLTLEDEFGFINCMVRPKIYETQPLDHEVFLCLEGKLQRDGSSHSIVIERKILPKVETAEYLEFQEKKFQNDSPSFFSVRNFY